MKTKWTKEFLPGFTMLEILLVLATISILTTIVIVAINPFKQLGDSRNAERQVDLNALSNAANQYSIDHGGQLPKSLLMACSESGDQKECEGGEFQIGTCLRGGSEVCNGAGDKCANLGVDLVSNYLTSIPFDPQGGTPERTFYSVLLSPNGRMMMKACNSELDKVIEMGN